MPADCTRVVFIISRSGGSTSLTTIQAESAPYSFRQRREHANNLASLRPAKLRAHSPLFLFFFLLLNLLLKCVDISAHFLLRFSLSFIYFYFFSVFHLDSNEKAGPLTGGTPTRLRLQTFAYVFFIFIFYFIYADGSGERLKLILQCMGSLSVRSPVTLQRVRIC